MWNAKNGRVFATRVFRFRMACGGVPGGSGLGGSDADEEGGGGEEGEQDGAEERAGRMDGFHWIKGRVVRGVGWLVAGWDFRRVFDGFGAMS